MKKSIYTVTSTLESFSKRAEPSTKGSQRNRLCRKKNKDVLGSYKELILSLLNNKNISARFLIN